MNFCTILGNEDLSRLILSNLSLSSASCLSQSWTGGRELFQSMLDTQLQDEYDKYSECFMLKRESKAIRGIVEIRLPRRYCLFQTKLCLLLLFCHKVELGDLPVAQRVVRSKGRCFPSLLFRERLHRLGARRMATLLALDERTGTRDSSLISQAR